MSGLTLSTRETQRERRKRIRDLVSVFSELSHWACWCKKDIPMIFYIITCLIPLTVTQSVFNARIGSKFFYYCSQSCKYAYCVFPSCSACSVCTEYVMTTAFHGQQCFGRCFHGKWQTPKCFWQLLWLSYFLEHQSACETEEFPTISRPIREEAYIPDNTRSVSRDLGISEGPVTGQSKARRVFANNSA